MNAKALYKHVYQMHRQDETELEELTRFIHFGTILGVYIPDSTLHVINAAGESWNNRDLCDTYDGWMDGVRRAVYFHRVFTPIGLVILDMMIAAANHIVDTTVTPEYDGT